MKKINFILLTISLLFTGSLFAGDEILMADGMVNEPIAGTDGFLSPLVNPAAKSFGNFDGFGFIINYDDDFKMEDVYRIMYGTDTFSFIYGKYNSKNFYETTSAFKLFNNFYTGHSFKWVNSDFKDGDYGISTLFRPSNLLSLAGKAEKVGKSDVNYRVGFGLRPFVFSPYLGNRVTVTGDFIYSEIEDENKWAKPIIGLQTELFNGIHLAGSYNMESETAGLRFSYNLRNLKFGAMSQLDDDNKSSYGSYFVSVNSKDYRFLPAVKPKHYDFKLRGEIVDEKEYYHFGSLAIQKGNQTSLEDFLEKIEILTKDPEIKGIVFTNPSLNTNFANLLEIRTAFLNFKRAGKSIVVYANSYGNVHYGFWASLADRLYLNPNGSVNLTGFSITLPYFGEMLEKIGIDIIDMKSHEHKSGFNIFAESEMTDYEKQDYLELLEDYYQILVYLIKEGRGDLLADTVENLIDNGPYFISQKALEAGLVDKLIYEDQLSEELKIFSPESYTLTSNMPKEKVNYDWWYEPESKIAIIYAQGSIIMGRGRPGSRIGARTTAEQIRKAREDRSVKGIILRVNSGGGSAFASDLIAREIKKCREANKPVVVSMGGAAASGGYYISAYANTIIAQPSTITGSIGVTGFYPSFQRLSEKLLINWSTVKKGENADFFAFGTEVREEHIEKLNEMTDATYWQFVDVVAEGRGMTRNEVHAVSQGKVWTGVQAKEIGLVDKLGGLDTAIEEIKRLTNSKNIYLEDFSYQPAKFFVPVQANFSVTSRLFNTQDQTVINNLEKVIKNWKLFEDEKVLLLSPVDYKIIK